METVNDGNDGASSHSQPLTEETPATKRQRLTTSIETVTSPSPSLSSSSSGDSHYETPSFLDVQEEILCWLPFKTVLRLRCVCRFLKALISERRFAKKHLHCSQTLFMCHHLVLYSTDEFPIWDFKIPYVFNSMSTIIHEEQLNCRRKIPRGYDLIVGSCDGILCFCGGRDRSSVLVWNPSIWKFKILPPFECEVHIDHFMIYGFGYDHLSNNYKVVAVCCCHLDDENGWNCETQVKIHTLGTSSWRRVQDFPSHVLVDVGMEKPGKFVSGTINWLLSTTTNQWVILSLDLAYESYRALSQPNYGGEALCNPTLGVLRDCLCVLFYGATFLDVWILKDYRNIDSWTKLFTAPYMELGYELLATRIEEGYESDLFDLRYISKDDQVLLEFNNEVVIYNSRNRSVKKLEIQDIYRVRFFTNIYIESLISP